MPVKKEKWLFDWKQLYSRIDAKVYKLTLADDSEELQGLIILSSCSQLFIVILDSFFIIFYKKISSK